MLGEGPGKGEHTNVTHYLDIVDDERIVYAYTMALDGRVHSASLATVQLEDENGGTKLTYTEHGAFLGESDGAESRKRGWQSLLDALQGTVHETRAEKPDA